MNIDSFFSDTLDNIILNSYIEKNKEEINSFHAIVEENNVSNISKCLSEKLSLECGQNISVDDSLFFEEFPLSELNVNTKLENEVIVNISSEDIFEEEQNQDPKSSQNNVLDPSLYKSPKIDSSPTTTLNLETWGLPVTILKKYESRNVREMFEWQYDCLNNPGVLSDHANLVYSAPTSAGKTLVAEILAIKTVLERKKKVIFILPFISVVREKVFYFQEILSPAGVRVDGFVGSYNPPGGFRSLQIAVCTIEKGNSLINRMLEEESLGQLGAVIVDEMHLLGDSSRGYLLELLLTKLLYMTRKNEEINVQIIGMSATLPNLQTLAEWLRAKLYVTNFRPVPLDEKIYLSGEIYTNRFVLERRLETLPGLETDTDNILQFCLETIEESCSVLIFCPTKNWCETLAQQISQAFCKLGNSSSELGRVLRKQLRSDEISELLRQLSNCPVGLDEILKKTVSFGVAFHHAGLTLDERDAIEGAFRKSVLRVLIATSTLSSGVNLPAKRVIIRTPLFQGKILSPLTYKQMAGRAGRLGKDSSGESILICQKNNYQMAKQLVASNSLEPVRSCLGGGCGYKLKRALLEAIASGVVRTSSDVKLFSDCTLLFSSKTEVENDPIEDSISFLIENEFVRKTERNGEIEYVATSLGNACLSSSISPEEGLALFDELDKARQSFVLDNELHLIYSVTPYSSCLSNIDWMMYLEMWGKLPKSMKRVGELVGVTESYIARASRGKTTNNSERKDSIHKRFYTSLALHDLVNEVPLKIVSKKFSCPRGTLQSLQHSAATFAGMVTSFARKLNWSCVEILISQFQHRLHFGVGRDLLDLMRLSLLNGQRARALYQAGIESLTQLAAASVCNVEDVLRKLVPFDKESGRDGETEWETNKRKKMRNIWITGVNGMDEREFAQMLIKEAREYLRIEMGMKEVKWDHSSDEEESSFKLEISPDHDLINNKETDTVLEKSNSSIICKKENDLEEDLIGSSQSDIETFKKSKKKRSSEDFTNPKKKKKLSQVNIVNVSDDDELLRIFLNEISSKTTVALSVACEAACEQKTKIGCKFIPKTEENFTYGGKKVKGISFSWGENNSYYLSLNNNSLNILKKILKNKKLNLCIIDCKEQMKIIKLCCNLSIDANIEDPKVADWLLNPDAKEKNLSSMVRNYCQEMVKISKITNGNSALDLNSSIDPKLRASVESIITWHLSSSIKKLLEDNSYLITYKTEMSMLLCLTEMELNGIGVNTSLLLSLSESLKIHLTTLEKHAYTLAGRRFSFNSSKEIAKILNICRGNKKVVTNKQILEQMDTPLSKIIIEWRKLNNTVVKMIYPLIRKVDRERIHGSCIIHTATGRVSMHEPNLQSIPRNFEIFDYFTNNYEKISCRQVFQSPSSRFLLSADYCQIELRLLAHFSKDLNLISILKTNSDVFKSIAAESNNIKESEVSDQLRQRAKQICYGIIYGMGLKALATQMSVSEEEAFNFVENFHNKYPSIKLFIERVISTCRTNGYVETLTGRKRFVPNINEENVAIRNQAERQSVNTKIQGSAADIAKKATILLDCNFKRKFDELSRPKLVLHLHDEFLYEVVEKKLKEIAFILKTTMENTVSLSVPLPVKLKYGRTWGTMTELIL